MADVVADAVSRGMLTATQDTTSAVRASDVVVVIVPMVTNEQNEIGFSAIDAATAAIGAGLTPGKLVIYETTLQIGTTAQRLRQQLEQKLLHLRAGEDFYLAYSPERVTLGRFSTVWQWTRRSLVVLTKQAQMRQRNFIGRFWMPRLLRQRTRMMLSLPS